MTPTELTTWIEGECALFPGKSALLMTDMDSGEVLHAINEGTQVVAASTIKVPILLCALEQVRRGKYTLQDPILLPPAEILPDTEVFECGQSHYTLWELLYWMIVESDNTATNVVLNLLGFDQINEYVHDTLGLHDTECNRKMLDWNAIAAGRNNYTSPKDQALLYRRLLRGEVLTQKLRDVACDMLGRQRSMDCFLRYLPQRVELLHKTGGLDFLCHDAGVFVGSRRLYLGIFTWDGPSKEGDNRQKQFIGRLTKAIYNTYMEGEIEP